MGAWNDEIVNEFNKYGGKGLHIILDYFLVSFWGRKHSWILKNSKITKEMEDKSSLSCKCRIHAMQQSYVREDNIHEMHI